MEPAASPEDGKPFRPPHPLAVALIERLRNASLPVLDFGSGSGRNSAALERAGFTVARVDDVTAASGSPFSGINGRFAAAISTHALLHGSRSAIAANLGAIAKLLARGGTLHATFGSVRDARFGAGRRLDASTFAPLDGDEAGVPHTFFERRALAALLGRHFTVELIEERSADDSAGAWAHRQVPLAGAVHWFVIARK